jgi:hypothetical protein
MVIVVELVVEFRLYRLELELVVELVVDLRLYHLVVEL